MHGAHLRLRFGLGHVWPRNQLLGAYHFGRLFYGVSAHYHCLDPRPRPHSRKPVYVGAEPGKRNAGSHAGRFHVGSRPEGVRDIAPVNFGMAPLPSPTAKWFWAMLALAGEELGELGGHIRTAGTKRTVQDGKTRVLRSQLEVGLPVPMSAIQAAIIVPLKMGSSIQGTLKFYYPKPSRISETQISVAEGFGQLLSTQIAALQLEEQKKLATSMELKALQSQINPHFLFNIINTMASLVRTDPNKARVMLREFAVFYRQTLENSSDLISLSREVEQTVRYLSLEQARFGEDRLAVEVDIGEEVRAMQVPAFMVQPLVENAVKHAMPAEGKLTISISGTLDGDDVYLHVNDDGIGMKEEALKNIMAPKSETGLGIAVKNINDRLRGYYGEKAYMDIQSELGKGTSVTLFLPDCCESVEALPGKSFADRSAHIR